MFIQKSEESFTIVESEAGERLDKILVARFGEAYSRSYFHHLFDQGLIVVNAKQVKKQHRSNAGDRVSFTWIHLEGIDLTPEDIPLEIIYEDPFVLVVNKPVGMVVHPAPGHHSGTFVHALLHHCGLHLEELDELRPGIVHRLDKDTSGLLIAAKTISTHQKLIRMFSQRNVDKEYLAICVGSPGNRIIEAPIARHHVRRKEMAICEEGKPAITQVTTLKTDGKLSIVKAKPLTGRTHQIRLHLQHLKAPILGDSLYGSQSNNKKYGAERQLLHAHRLQFKHPETDRLLDLTAPLPLDIAVWMAQLGYEVKK